MVSVCTVPARGGRSCEHFGGYKTINRIPLPLIPQISHVMLTSLILFYIVIILCILSSEPNVEHITKRAGRLISEFKELVFPDGYTPGAKRKVIKPTQLQMS